MENKFYKNNGFLSEYGDDYFGQYIYREIKSVLDNAKSESDARLLGSLLQKYVGDMVTDHIVSLKDKK